MEGEHRITDRIDQLLEDYTTQKEYVENQKPYWLYLDAKDKLEWELFNYFPEAHYKKAVDQAFENLAESKRSSGDPQENLGQKADFPDFTWPTDWWWRVAFDHNSVDEFGRTLGEQIRDQILWEYFRSETRHMIQKEYEVDTSHQDGDLPYRMQISHQDGGPNYLTNDYFPHFHYQTGAVLADESYELLPEYWGTEVVDLNDIEADSEAIDTLAAEGAADDMQRLNQY